MTAPYDSQSLLGTVTVLHHDLQRPLNFCSITYPYSPTSKPPILQSQYSETTLHKALLCNDTGEYLHYGRGIWDCVLRVTKSILQAYRSSTKNTKSMPSEGGQRPSIYTGPNPCRLRPETLPTLTSGMPCDRAHQVTSSCCHMLRPTTSRCTENLYRCRQREES
jgi:hypothetical protein